MMPWTLPTSLPDHHIAVNLGGNRTCQYDVAYPVLHIFGGQVCLLYELFQVPDFLDSAIADPVIVFLPQID